MAERLTTKEVLERFGIPMSTLNLWLKSGCPKAGIRKIKGKQGGRPTRTFDAVKLAAWVEKNGKKAPGLQGEALRNTERITEPVHNKKPKEELIKALGMMGYLERVRQQEKYLFAKFSRVAQDPESTGAEISAVSRALSAKGEELRRAEMTALDHQKQTGELVNLEEAQRTFVELASILRERVMGIPNELAPILRDYLSDVDDIGKVRDEIDSVIRHALMSLPDVLPEIKSKNINGKKR